MRRPRSLVLAAFVLFAADVARADELPPYTPPPPAQPTAPEPPLGGFHNGTFFLRDHADNFRLYVQGRVHADLLGWIGPGVPSLGPDSALKTTFQLRRARAEIGGEFLQGEWQWQLSGDFGPTSVDNPAAKNAAPSCTVDPVAGTDTCSGTASAAVEAPRVSAFATDAFINYAPSPWLNVQVGQYLLPFGMEARISDNTTPFLERGIVARLIAAPFTRDIGAMVWGEAPDRFVYYTLGLYNGDGPNRPNADSRFDFVGHVIVRPLETSTFHGVLAPLRHAQIGFSARYGSRDPREVGYDLPSLTTQGGYAFWKATYKDSLNRTLHIIPSSEHYSLGLDAYVPIDGFDLRGEFAYTNQNTREAIDGYQLSPFTERLGTMKGWAYGVQAAYWIFGSRDIIGYPSYGKPLHVDLKTEQKPPSRGLQALAKVEQLHLSYAGATRAGVLDPKTPNGDIDVLAFAFGLNYWATRHLRVGLNYSIYTFPDSAPVTASAAGGPVQSPNQRAVAPAQALVKGVDDGARDGGHNVHEVHARVGVQF